MWGRVEDGGSAATSSERRSDQANPSRSSGSGSSSPAWRICSRSGRRTEAEIRQRQTALAAVAQHEHEQAEQAAQRSSTLSSAALARTYKEAREEVFRSYEAAGFKLALGEERGAGRGWAGTRRGSARRAKRSASTRARRFSRPTKSRASGRGASSPSSSSSAKRRQVEIQSLITQAQKIVRRRCPWPDDAAPPAAGCRHAGSSLRRNTSSGSRPRCSGPIELVYALQHLRSARFLEDGWPVLIFLLAIPLVGLASLAAGARPMAGAGSLRRR